MLGVPKIGDYDDLINFVRRSEIEMVIISLPLEAEERINWLLEMLKVLPVEVRLSAFSEDYVFSPTARDPLIAAIRGTFAPERRLTKRVFDSVFASLALLLVWLVLLRDRNSARNQRAGFLQAEAARVQLPRQRSPEAPFDVCRVNGAHSASRCDTQ